MCAPGFLVFATLCVLCSCLPGGRGGYRLLYNSVETMKVLLYKPGEEAGSAENVTIYSHENVPLLQFMHANFKSVHQVRIIH